ncbi:MAG: hypothetical protein AAF413_00190 [Patescibacteria group bacterium]
MIHLLIRLRFVILGLILAGIGLLITSRISFISLELPSPQEIETTVSLTDKGSLKNSQITIPSGSTTARRLVFGNNYQLRLRSGDRASIEAVDTRGFFRTSSVTADLRQKPSVEFIANNPGPCSFTESGVVYSYTCGGSLDTMSVHIPPDGQQPGYVSGYTGSNPSLAIIDTATLNGKTILHLESTDGAKYLAEFDSGNVAEIAVINNLSQPEYRLLERSNDIVLYSSNLRQVLVFNDIGSTPNLLAIPEPSNKTLVGHELRHLNDRLLAVYSDAFKDQAIGDSDVNSGELGDNRGESELIVFGGGEEIRLPLDQTRVDVGFCSGSLICVHTGGQLDVYRLSNNSIQKATDYTGVEDMAYTASGGYILFAQQIALLDEDSASVHEVISNSAGFCGIHQNDSVLSVCTTVRGRKHLVRLVESSSYDRIIEAYQTLSISPDIDSLSIHKNTIHISPIRAKTVQDPGSRFSGQDPVERAEIRSRVEAAIQNAGIPSDYEVYIL